MTRAFSIITRANYNFSSCIVPASITAPNEHIVLYNFVLLIDGSC